VATVLVGALSLTVCLVLSCAAPSHILPPSAWGASFSVDFYLNDTLVTSAADDDVLVHPEMDNPPVSGTHIRGST
jgi:hypothetical protein